MQFSDFFKFLLVAALVSVGTFFLLNIFLPLLPYVDLLGGSVIFFSAMALLAYLLGNKSIKSGGAGYIGLVMANVFLKLIASFILVAMYAKYKQPDDRFFLIPFLITYLVFTIYEIYFMSAQARETR